MIRHISMGLMMLLLQSVSMAVPTVNELLDKFSETADKTHTSFIAKSKLKIVSEHKYSGKWAYANGQRTATRY